ncbi:MULTISPECIES: hypothetical protein [Hyphobacterium]|uniref:EamA domain-containing protein n=1 Tax=Hyphobacterium vulgare TaxID=1736751 RepID=A0ABV7A0Q0_9PROT
MRYYIVSFGGSSSPISVLFGLILAAFLWGTTGIMTLGLGSRSIGLDTVFADLLPDSEILYVSAGPPEIIFGMWQQFFAEAHPVSLGMLLGFLIAVAILVIVVPRLFSWIFGLVPPLAFWLTMGGGWLTVGASDQPVALLVGTVIFAWLGLASVNALKDYISL